MTPLNNIPVIQGQGRNLPLGNRPNSPSVTGEPPKFARDVDLPQLPPTPNTVGSIDTAGKSIGWQPPAMLRAIARVLRLDGSVVTPTAEARPVPKLPTGALAAYKAQSARLVELRQAISDFHARMRPHHAAPATMTAAREALKRLQEADTDAAGKAAFEGVTDTDAPARARAIAEAEAAVAQAQRAAGIAAKAISAGERALAPLTAEAKSIEAGMPLAIRNALLEQMADLAPEYRRVREQFLAVQVHAFALAKVIDGLTELRGFEASLTLSS